MSNSVDRDVYREVLRAVLDKFHQLYGNPKADVCVTTSGETVIDLVFTDSPYVVSVYPNRWRVIHSATGIKIADGTL